MTAHADREFIRLDAFDDAPTGEYIADPADAACTCIQHAVTGEKEWMKIGAVDTEYGPRAVTVPCDPDARTDALDVAGVVATADFVWTRGPISRWLPLAKSYPLYLDHHDADPIGVADVHLDTATGDLITTRIAFNGDELAQAAAEDLRTGRMTGLSPRITHYGDLSARLEHVALVEVPRNPRARIISSQPINKETNMTINTDAKKPAATTKTKKRGPVRTMRDRLRARMGDPSIRKSEAKAMREKAGADPNELTSDQIFKLRNAVRGEMRAAENTGATASAATPPAATPAPEARTDAREHIDGITRARERRDQAMRDAWLTKDAPETPIASATTRTDSTTSLNPTAARDKREKILADAFRDGLGRS